MSSAVAMKAEPTSLNGVDVIALLDTISAVKHNPKIAAFNFRVSNKWIDGDQNRTTIRDFTGALQKRRTDGKEFVVENGEHPVLLGQDKAPNPVEWLLHALVGCVTTSTAYHAAARGLAIDAIDSQVDGDLDLRGFLGLSDDVRKGYSAIRMRMRMKTKADPATIKSLTTMSPVLDVVSRSVPVDIHVETY